MSHYSVSVIYACRGSRTGEVTPFPDQTIASGDIQILPVIEEDFYHPRKNSIRAAAQADGQYTIFLDEGDTFSETFLQLLKQNTVDPGVAFCMPFASFRYIAAAKGYFSNQPKKNLLVTTNGTIPILPLELHGLMIRTADLKEAIAQLTSETEEEKQILLALLQKRPAFCFLRSCQLTYEQPREYDIQYDLRCLSAPWYYDSLETFLLPRLLEEQQTNGSISPLMQVLALHMVSVRIFANINNLNKHVIAPKAVAAYMELFHQILSFTDTSRILQHAPNGTIASKTNRLFLLRLKKGDFSFYPSLCSQPDLFDLTCDGLSYAGKGDISLRINLIDYKNGCLEIDGAINDFFSMEETEIFADFDGKQYPLIWNSRYSLTKCFGVTYSRMKTFHVSVPVSDSKKKRILNFVLCTKTNRMILDYAFPSHTSRYSKDFTYGYWKFGSYISWWNKAGIHIVPSSKLLVLRKELLLWRQMYRHKNKEYRKQIPLKMLNFVLRPYFSRQKIWLFFDKIYKGGDSSEYMYRYALQQKDGIKKYYLLDPACPDYSRMKKEGYRPLTRGTLKHRLIFLNADLVIASNSTVFAFNDYTVDKTHPFRGDFRMGTACVQHGMSVQKIALAQQRLRDNTKLYFCASKYEIENLSKPIYDYQGYDALKLTGVPRYDGLKNRAEKIIVLSPTWRMNSAVPVSKNEGVARDYNPNFRETDYYRIYNNLINDPRLLESAKKHGYRIQYVLHPIVSPQAEDFTKNDFVEIIPSTGDMSYEKIFCEGALMVTDFSGVQFDFAYMRKPVVYLHHQDIPQHYEEGTFHYKTMGFGEICTTNDELIDVLCRYMENNCEMPEQYRKRADDFFHFSDHDNCARIYPHMLEYTKQNS